jgi:Delta7-sterol 5-desaturase
MFLPWDTTALAVYGFGQIAFNLIGHLGYEVYPANWNQLLMRRWKTPGLHHYLHHQMVSGNYGLYFRWWDKWCRTEFADFEARYDRIFATSSSKSEACLHTASTRL